MGKRPNVEGAPKAGAAQVDITPRPGVQLSGSIAVHRPAQWTFVAHCVNQYVGYIPVRHALDRGGHEVNTATWAKLAPDALERIVETARKQVGELFKA